MYKNRLSADLIDYLWKQIKIAESNSKDLSSGLAGNITRSLTMEDPDAKIIRAMINTIQSCEDAQDRMNENLLTITNTLPRLFTNKKLVPLLDALWVNFQKKYEFNPPHLHKGTLSFVIWMKIPYDIKDEEELPWVKSSNAPRAGHFSFLSSNCLERSIPLSKEYEGVFCIFPSSLKHMVYPFYTTNHLRVSISGNISFQLGN